MSQPGRSRRVSSAWATLSHSVMMRIIAPGNGPYFRVTHALASGSMMLACRFCSGTRRQTMRRRQAAIPFILVTILIDVLGIGLIVPILPELIVVMTGGESSQGSSVYGIFIAVYAAMQFLFAP